MKSAQGAARRVPGLLGGISALRSLQGMRREPNTECFISGFLLGFRVYQGLGLPV